MSGDATPQGAPNRPAPTRARLLAIGIPLAWFLAGLIVYGVDLDRPNDVVFDELHYLRAAREHANGTWIDPAWGDERPYNWEHPPVAKYWMAAAIDLFGYEPAAWRAPSVLHGALGLAGIALLSARLFGNTTAAVLAPLLLVLDPMWYVLSRLAMLEIFVIAPLLWAFAFALGNRPWERWAAGGALGYALAVKYTAFFMLPLLVLVLFLRDVHGPADARLRSLGRPAYRALLPAVLLPLVLFFVSYLPILIQYAQSGGIGYMVSHWWFVFTESVSWGATGPDEHPEITPPLLWLPMVRPTWFWVLWGEGGGAGQTVRTIYAVGNPVVWWSGIALGLGALLGPLVRLAVRVRRAAKTGGDWKLRIDAVDARTFTTTGFAFLLFLFAYLPFFLVSRATFLYYMAFVSPWLALTAAGVLASLLNGPRPPRDQAAVALAESSTRRWPSVFWQRRAAALLLLTLALVVFVYWLPLFSAVPTDRATVNRVWELVPWMQRVSWG